jgi:hypothetical protein
VSNKKHTDAILAGYDGPFFPASVDDLRKQLDEVGRYNGDWLKKAGDTIDGFVGEVDRPTTSDGYVWFWSLEFSCGSGKVTVLIPWSQDWEQSDGTQGDRGIAVHTKNTDEATANEVVLQCVEAAKQHYEYSG